MSASATAGGATLAEDAIKHGSEFGRWWLAIPELVSQAMGTGVMTGSVTFSFGAFRQVMEGGLKPWLEGSA